jgi:uncharacterized membrane protein YfhO
MEVKLTPRDWKRINLPQRKDETPNATVMLYLSVNNEPLSYKGAMEMVATAISLRFGYPVWKEITQRNMNWGKVYCQKVLDVAMEVIKKREKEKDSEALQGTNTPMRIKPNVPRKRSQMRIDKGKKKS